MYIIEEYKYNILFYNNNTIFNYYHLLVYTYSIYNYDCCSEQ